MARPHLCWCCWAAAVTAMAWWPTPRAAGRELYLSSSSGSDTNAGTTPSRPWRTFARLGTTTLHPGDTVHLFPGDTFDEPMVVLAQGWGCPGAAMEGFFEGVQITPAGVRVLGWVVDTAVGPAGLQGSTTRPVQQPVGVLITVDGEPVLETVADVPRPDLVKAGVAPAPAKHGLAATLPAAAAATLRGHGVHVVQVLANVSGCPASYGWTLPLNARTERCACDGAACECPAALPSLLPLRITGVGSAGTGQRARIRLGGSGTAVTVRGFDSVRIDGLEFAHATAGIAAHGSARTGMMSVEDAVFRGVWNRSSIGQSQAHDGRDCSNGWTASVAAGDFGGASVRGCVFDDIDVAFQPTGALATVAIEGNTISRANGNTVLMVGQTEWLVSCNVFSRNYAPRFFMCGTTDIMIGGLGTRGAIRANEIGWRGEQPGSPDGCGIDYEGGSDGVAITDNFIHDSFGAGIMVFGLSDRSRNISNATIARNLFLRNGAQQTSEDHGEIAFMEHGSTGSCRDNVFFASDPDPSFVLHESTNGTLDLGWNLGNNTIRALSELPAAMSDTPQLNKIVYTDGGSALVTVVSRNRQPRATAVLWTLDGSWPQPGAAGTNAAAMGARGAVDITLPRTAALNVRFVVPGLLPSVTVSVLIPVPFAVDSS